MEANPTSQLLSHNTAEKQTSGAGRITAHSPRQTWWERWRQRPGRLTPAHGSSCVTAPLRGLSFKTRQASTLAALSEEPPYCEVYVQDAPPPTPKSPPDWSEWRDAAHSRVISAKAFSCFNILFPLSHFIHTLHLLTLHNSYSYVFYYTLYIY